MKKITIDKIFTEHIIKNKWIAKTTFYHPNKWEIEMKGDSEQNAYLKLVKFLELKKEPLKIEELLNQNKIYHFKKN